jgi:hypothetical protein
MIARVLRTWEFDVSTLGAQSWKAGISGTRIPTPDEATSMLRSIWSQSSRLGTWPASSVASLLRRDSHVDKTESRRISRFFQWIGAAITNLFLNRGHKSGGNFSVERNR